MTVLGIDITETDIIQTTLLEINQITAILKGRTTDLEKSLIFYK